jgi:hypothetical protein
MLLLSAVCVCAASAQEMEPRAYSRAPVGTQFVLVTYGYQSGDVFTDSSLPLKDVSINLSSMSLGYGRTFGLKGRQASATFLMPYIKGSASGTLFEERQNVTRSGLADLRARFSMNLIGSPAMRPKEFAAYKPRTVVGASITIIAPSGQYDSARLVNLSSHRWAFKPEIGISKPVGRWTLEAAAGSWLFTANHDFFGGVLREQKPLLSVQGAVIYTLRRRMWISWNSTFYTGGSSVVNGIVNKDRQRNTRVGATFSLPLTQQQSLKVAWAKGVTTRIGSSLNSLVFGWQYTWLSNAKTQSRSIDSDR